MRVLVKSTLSPSYEDFLALDLEKSIDDKPNNTSEAVAAYSLF
jgi:hypothetical protein